MQRKIRIAYLVPGREFAGVESVVHELAQRLSADYSDHLEVHVVFCARFAELEGVAVRYRSHCLGQTKLSRMFPSLVDFFRRERLDVTIVAQCEMATLCFFAQRAAGRASAFVPYLHGNPQREEAGSAKSRFLFFLFRTIVAPNAACIFAVSESLARHVRGDLAGRTPVYFSPNPVRKLESAGDAAPPATFLCVARLSRQKGHDILLKAFAQVRSRRPSVTLSLVGAGEEESALKARCAALGVKDAVTFHGRHANPARFFRSASCFVLASRWEGFGQVLVEALGFGLPLVVTDCDFGPADLVDDPRIGTVARSEDPDDLARAMISAIDTPVRAEDVRLRQERAQRFAPDKVAPIHFDLLCKANGASAGADRGLWRALGASP